VHLLNLGGNDCEIYLRVDMIGCCDKEAQGCYEKSIVEMKTVVDNPDSFAETIAYLTRPTKLQIRKSS
jgi:hypothetical protein